MRACLFAAICIFAYKSMYAQNLIWRKHNPWHRVFYGLSVQPDGRVCVSVDSVIYIGSRGLSAWDSIKGVRENNRTILAQKMVMRNNGELYITNDAMGLYRSSNNGLSWEGSLVNEGCESVAFNPDGVVFAGISYTGNGRAHRSRNNCATWQAIPLPNLPGYPTLGYTFQGHETVFAQTISGIYKSIDTGSTWAASAIPATGVRAQTLCQSATGKLYVIASQKIARSFDNGVTWSAVTPAGLPPNTYFTYLACGADNRLYAASSTIVYRSADDGETWTAVFSSSPYTNINYLEADELGYLYFGTYREIYQAYIGLDPALYSAHLPIKISNGSANIAQVTLGLSPFATNGLDSLLGEFRLPVPAASGVFDARLILPGQSAIQSFNDFRNDTVRNTIWRLALQKGEQTEPLILSWMHGALPSGAFILYDSSSSGVQVVDMKSDSTYTINRTGSIYLQIRYSAVRNASISLVSGWNLVSVPVVAQQMTAASVFGATNTPVFSYQNGYQSVQDLQNGYGYWVKSPALTLLQLSGTVPQSAAIPVMPGWNLIGVYDQPVQVNSITPVPVNIISSSFFGYQSGYYFAQELQCGKGYWVKASAPGTLFLSGGPEGKRPLRSIANQSLPRIECTDALGNRMTLYHVATSNDNLILPPAPPQGVFDIRFASNRYSENLDRESVMLLQGIEYPLSLSVHNLDICFTDVVTNGKLFNKTAGAGDVLRLNDKSVSSLRVSRIQKPSAFTLEQNYPNPFNPECKISYQISSKAPVVLSVYDTQGEQIAVLVNEVQEPGKYSVVFNAERLHSGVYFYTLMSANNRAVRKMIVIK